jgi:cell division protein FtsB
VNTTARIIHVPSTVFIQLLYYHCFFLKMICQTKQQQQQQQQQNETLSNVIG